MRDQRIRDPIHNLIKFSAKSREDEVLWELIQLPVFQRLRRIKQLGFSEIVYPGAAHTRFSHSLGALQMARRMLDVLERNLEIGDTEDHPLRRCATLCAALLHDVGHGPFSHVFEEISEKVEVEIAHEDRTKEIIESDAVSDVLNSFDNDLPALVASFFNTESGYSPYTSIVSSQLDCDRLDYLVRDIYFAGIGFVSIDLDWLFDCLTISKVPIDLDSDAEAFAFISTSKALPVLVSYAHGYAEMYNRVYFHKTTRSAQYMVEEILFCIYSDQKLMEKLPDGDPLRAYFTAGNKPPLDLYLRLDDYSVWRVIDFVAHSDFGRASQLAQRFLQRDLFKCFTPPINLDNSVPKTRIKSFIAELKNNGIHHYIDQLKPKNLKHFESNGIESFKNILILDDRDNEPKSLQTFSPAVKELAPAVPIRFYFDTAEERNAAREIWKQ